MYRIKLGGNVLEFYDSPVDLPIVNYFEYQFYSSLAMAIDFETLTEQIGSIQNSIENDNKEAAYLKLHNLKLSFLSAKNKTEIKWLAIGQLLKSVGGKKPDMDEDYLKTLMLELSPSGLTKKLVDDTFDILKKKFMPLLYNVDS